MSKTAHLKPLSTIGALVCIVKVMMSNRWYFVKSHITVYGMSYQHSPPLHEALDMPRKPLA